MAKHQTAQTSPAQTKSQPSGLAAPLTFFIGFITLVYGVLFLGFLGVANWFIHEKPVTFLLNMGGWGVFLGAVSIVLLWIMVVFVAAFVPYVILRALSKRILAAKVAAIITVALFNIFILPLILWRAIRNASPRLKQNHLNKLKKMAKGPLMQERLAERRLKLRQGMK